MSGPRVLLTTLSVRTSAKGNQYLAGWLGKASVVAFAGEPDKFGNPTWDLYLCEPEPREGQPRPGRSPQGREAASGGATAPPSPSARPGGPARPYRRERGAGALDDPIPF